MKRNLLLFSLMVICSNLIFAMPLDTRKQIKMKVRVKIEHRSANLPSPVQAYVNNSLLEIEFEHPSNDVTILKMCIRDSYYLSPSLPMPSLP